MTKTPAGKTGGATQSWSAGFASFRCKATYYARSKESASVSGQT
jgi:hypothetical protein